MKVKYIAHKNLKDDELSEIVKIKSIAWPYSMDQQIKWINNNLKGNDIHVLLVRNNKNIAYLNLIEIDIRIDGNMQTGFGVGNVCATKKGKGYGKDLMIQTNNYLTQRNKIGLLFCKKQLVNFYCSNNWVLIEKEKLFFLFNNESIETMVYNWINDFRQLVYLGKPF